MKGETWRRFFPPGPVLSLTLLGFMIFGGLLYSKAVKAQRFLEPVLAITQPSITFSENLSRLILAEFGGDKFKGIRFLGDSIYVESSLLSSGLHRPDEVSVLKKLARVLISALRDPEMTPHIDLILVSATVRKGGDPEVNRQRRKEMRDRAGLVLNSLYREEPLLESEYSTRFAATVKTSEVPEGMGEWVEFRIVHSQMLHIEVLKRFQKYAR